MSEITAKEAIEFISEWGIDPDEYILAHFRHLMSGNIVDDNSCELYDYHRACLKKVVELAWAKEIENNGKS